MTWMDDGAIALLGLLMVKKNNEENSAKIGF